MGRGVRFRGNYSKWKERGVPRRRDKPCPEREGEQGEGKGNLTGKERGKGVPHTKHGEKEQRARR